MIKVNKVFLLILALSFVFALLNGGNVPYGIFYSLLAIFIVGFVYMLIESLYLGAEVVFKKTIKSAGDTDECLTIIKCDTMLPVPYVMIKSDVYKNSFSGYNGELVNITMDENPWLRTNIKFYQRGIYDFGTVTLKMMDLIGLFECNKVVDDKVNVKVYPKIYEIKKLPFGGKDIYEETVDLQSSNEDMFSIKNVRKYRQGDNLKKIHWKVSAKHGELYVRDYETIAGQKFTIFLDMRKSNLDFDKYGEIEERIVDLCVSIVCYMQSKGIGTRIFINALKPMDFTIDSKEDFNSFMEFLVSQKSDGDMDFDRFIFQNLYRLQKINKIAVISGELDERLINCLVDIKRTGYSVTAFYCMDSQKSEDNEVLLKKFGMQCFKFDDVII